MEPSDEGPTPTPGGGKGFDWSRITVGALSLVALAAGVKLISVTSQGTTEGGAALIVVGSVLAGAWLVITIIRDMRE